MSSAQGWVGRVGQRVVVRHRLPDGSATDVVGELLHADPAGTVDGRLVVAGREGEVAVPLGAVLAGKVVPPRPVRAAPPHRALSIDDLERVMALHWLPHDHEYLGDWLLRAAGGFTGRGNSVLVIGSAGLPGPQAVERVAAWYAARDLPPRAAVPGPSEQGPDEHASAPPAAGPFVEAGWQPVRGAGALVLTAATRPLTTGPALPAGLTIDLDPVPDDQWRALYRYRGQDLPPSALELLMSAPEQTFVSVRSGGRTIALGRGSLASAWLGVTAVEVAPDHRGRGLARVVLAALARWAAAKDARSTCLQVGVTNEPAQRLYLSAGFTVQHRYDYYVPQP